MNTKLLMTLSALAMAITGVLLSFAPREILYYLTAAEPTHLHTVVLQLMGALYFGFAAINWTAKANLIGGIYARPIAMGNLCHFVIGALALIKGYLSSYETTLLIPAVLYGLFAACFSIVFFTHPVADKND